MKITSKVLAFALAAVLLIGGVSIPAYASDDTYIVPLGKYSEIKPFSDGVAIVYGPDGGAGAIDTTGREIIPLGEYSFMDSFSDGVAWATEWDHSKWNGQGEVGLIDKTGNVIIPHGKYNWVSSFSGGVTIVRRASGEMDWVIIDTSGRELVSLGDRYRSYRSVKQGAVYAPFSDGMAVVFDGYDECVINTAGREILRYEDGGSKLFSLAGFSDGVAVEYSLDGDGLIDGVGVIDKTGKVIVPYGKYQNISEFHDGMAVVSNYSESINVYGVIDTSGREVVPFGKYSYIMDYSDGVAVVGGATVVDAYYNKVTSVGVIDKTGKEIIPLSTKYKKIDPFCGGMATVYESVYHGAPRGVIDKNGKEILPVSTKYAEISNFYNGLAIVNAGMVWDSHGGGTIINDGEWGVITLGTSPAPTDNPSSWAQADVTTAITSGLVPSSLQSKYTQATTRAEFCALAVALYEKVTGKEITERTTFNDTTDVNVQKMGALGVVTGVGSGNFAPDQKLTREQAATMLSRLANAVGKPLASSAAAFADNSSISTWAIESVGQIQAAGIMGGVGNNTFSPKTDYTREQSIVTILRLYNAVK